MKRWQNVPTFGENCTVSELDRTRWKHQVSQKRLIWGPTVSIIEELWWETQPVKFPTLWSPFPPVFSAASMFGAPVPAMLLALGLHSEALEGEHSLNAEQLITKAGGTIHFDIGLWCSLIVRVQSLKGQSPFPIPCADLRAAGVWSGLLCWETAFCRADKPVYSSQWVCLLRSPSWSAPPFVGSVLCGAVEEGSAPPPLPPRSHCLLHIHPGGLWVGLSP